ncbi:MAG: ImmA/IrrE family metallo-endopeptidase [Chloroflexi bacterium]|nr:ImmA/IrrE family metallo-endopeptidase [Chloroflexota bacterium]
MRSVLSRSQYVDQAEGRATALRQDFGLGTDAVADVFEFLGHLGLDLVRRPMGENGPDGFYIRKGDLVFVAVNTDRRLGRQRFTACHELAHHLFDQQSWIDDDVFAKNAVPERRANAFAASFLMPREGVERWLGRHNHGAGRRSPLDVEAVVHLARHFGMSYQATLLRLLELRYLDPGQYADLKLAQPERIARRLGYDLSTEDGAVRCQVLPPRFVQLALQAYGEGCISLARLAELLRTGEDTATRLVAESGIEPYKPSLEELIEEARNA